MPPKAPAKTKQELEEQKKKEEEEAQRAAAEAARIAEEQLNVQLCCRLALS